MPNVKRKARVKEKMLRRREQAILDRKEANLEFKREQERKKKRNPVTQEQIQRENLEKLMPIDIDTLFTGQTGDLTREQAIEKIKHNLEILKALEQEFEKEEAERAKNNAELDEQGVVGLKEKVAEMQKKLAAQTGFKPVT